MLSNNGCEATAAKKITKANKPPQRNRREDEWILDASKMLKTSHLWKCLKQLEPVIGHTFGMDWQLMADGFAFNEHDYYEEEVQVD